MNATLLEVAAGSIPGRDHLGRHPTLIGKNNQDAYHWEFADDALIAVVSDGCGSKPHSEVGAKIAARLLVTIIGDTYSRLRRGNIDSDMEFPWRRVERDFLAELRALAREMSGATGSFSQTIDDYFLFTFLGVIITPQFCQLVSVGDGIYSVNEETVGIGPFPDNRPPYISYQLVDSEFSKTPELLEIQVQRELPTEELETLLIGTDGIEDFIAAEEQKIPGLDTCVGPLSQFWREDRYFRNRDNVRRRLALVNREVHSIYPDKTTSFTTGAQAQLRTEHGILRDDTTLIVVRQKREESNHDARTLHSRTASSAKPESIVG